MPGVNEADRSLAADKSLAKFKQAKTKATTKKKLGRKTEEVGKAAPKKKLKKRMSRLFSDNFEAVLGSSREYELRDEAGPLPVLKPEVTLKAIHADDSDARMLGLVYSIDGELDWDSIGGLLRFF